MRTRVTREISFLQANLLPQNAMILRDAAICSILYFGKAKSNCEFNFAETLLKKGCGGQLISRCRTRE